MTRDEDTKVIRRMRADGDSYGEIAEALGRTKSDIYRVCMTLAGVSARRCKYRQPNKSRLNPHNRWGRGEQTAQACANACLQQLPTMANVRFARLFVAMLSQESKDVSSPD